MSLSIKSFLDALATYMAAQAGLSLATDLFIGQAVEPAGGLDLYSTLASYGGGDVPFVAMATIPCQVMTVGKGNAAAMARADVWLATLLDGTSQWPKRNVALSGFRLMVVDNLRPPGLVGRDDVASRYAMNFDAVAVPT